MAMATVLENSTPAVAAETPASTPTSTVAGQSTTTPTQTTPIVPATTTPVTPTATPLANVPTWETEKQTMETKMRQFQADRDRAEAKLKETYKNMMPYVDVDQFGNIVGTRKPEPDPNILLNQLNERAQKGDAQAIVQLQEIQASQMEQRVMAKMNQERELERTVQTVEANIKKTFPSIIKADGQFNENDPILLKARQIANESPAYDLSNPYQLQAILEQAQARLIIEKFPDIEKRLREEVLQQQAQSGGNMLTTPHTPPVSANTNYGDIPQEQMNQWNREGYKTPADIERVANIFRQAQKEKGYLIS
jgi:type II secretory pathway component PulJ